MFPFYFHSVQIKVLYYSSSTDAPLITESMSGKYIKEEGTTLNLTCKFTSNPAPIIGWTLNSSAILNSANGYNVSSSEDTQIYRVLSNATLYMANLQRTMQGYYACTAENHQGFAQKVTTVIVHCKYKDKCSDILYRNNIALYFPFVIQYHSIVIQICMCKILCTCLS